MFGKTDDEKESHSDLGGFFFSKRCSLNRKNFSVGPNETGYINQFGQVLSNVEKNYNGKSGDAYYIAVSSERKLFVGTQLNGSSSITWREI